MSLKQQQLVWDHSRASSSMLVLLLAYANFADDDGLAWPGARTLARMARLDIRSTRRLIKELVANGELAVVEKGGGRRRTTKYRITINSDTENTDSRVTVSQNSGRGNSDLLRRNSDGGTTRSVNRSVHDRADAPAQRARRSKRTLHTFDELIALEGK